MAKDSHYLDNELEALLRVPGVSGNEGPIRDHIKYEVEKHLKTGISVDNLGNLIATVGEAYHKHLVLIAHMDELGMVVAKIEHDGSIRIRKVGGIDDRTLISRHVELLTKKGIAHGVIGLKPPHLMPKDDRSEMKKVLTADEMFVDVGTRSKKETEALGIKVLTPMVLRKDFTILNKDILCGRGIDDRFGCLVLMEVIRRMGAKRLGSLGIKVSFVWSVQEEMGLRGAYAIGDRLRPDYVIAVDTCSTTDAPGMPTHIAPFHVGEGPGLRIMDSEAIASPAMTELIEGVGRKNKIPLQTALTGGNTDGSAIQLTGALMVPIGLPVRYTHSTVECISRTDLEWIIQLVIKVLEALGKDPL